MKFTELFTADGSERAVSPVIGVILMVAITVILAAVIGTFVLGLGDQVQQTSPNAQWDWDANSSNALVLTQTGGDNVDPALLSVSGSPSDSSCDGAGEWKSLTSDSEITAGANCAVVNKGAGTTPGDEYTLTWQAEGGGSSATLSTYEA
jgi:flagellin-like protein